MTPEEFLKIMLANIQQFADAASSGAGWEIAAQTIINNAFRTSEHGSIKREWKYNDGDTADFLIGSGETVIIIELKVESATNKGQFAGVSLGKAIENDTGKLAKFVFDPNDFDGYADCATWMMLIAYSPSAREALKNINGAIVVEENGVAIAIVPVDHQ